MSTNNFDDRAATWDDDPAKIERARVVANAIRTAVPLDRTTSLLEYGAGTGLVTAELRGDVGSVTMADTSAGMREVMEAKVASGAIPDARIWDLDLSTQSPPDERFDLIITVLTLHHITDLDPVLVGFATLLNDGGHLCIVDLEEEDGTFHGGDFDGHHGFAPADLERQLIDAGLSDVAFERVHHLEKNQREYPIFMATATALSRT